MLAEKVEQKWLEKGRLGLHQWGGGTRQTL